MGRLLFFYMRREAGDYLRAEAEKRRRVQRREDSAEIIILWMLRGRKGIFAFTIAVL